MGIKRYAKVPGSLSLCSYSPVEETNTNNMIIPTKKKSEIEILTSPPKENYTML